MDLQFDYRDVLDAAQREAVNAVLRDHNRAANPDFWAAQDRPELDARPLNVLATDAKGRVAGGLLSETRFNWLKIAVVSVRADARRAGVGSRLVVMAEDEARIRGCLYSYADTMDYQAPGFYERLRYDLAGRLDDWDSHGHAKLFFVKRLW